MEKNDFIERSGGGKYVQYSKTDKFPSFKGGPQDQKKGPQERNHLIYNIEQQDRKKSTRIIKGDAL